MLKVVWRCQLNDQGTRTSMIVDSRCTLCGCNGELFIGHALEHL